MFPDYDSVSARLYDRATSVLVGGNSRFSVYTPPYQIYAARGSGSRVFDVDGNERLDFQNNMTVLIHGHAHPVVVERVTEQIKRGSCFGLASESEIELAELLCMRVPGFERVRFVNSGTEAVMTAIKAARARTGRSKIAKVEGAYHGSYDYAEVSLTSTSENWGDIDAPHSVAYAYGTPRSVLDDVVIIPFNQPEKALNILHAVKDELAGVLIDPLPARVGLIPATSDFLEAIRDFTRSNGSLLIFDEVICFRLGYKGAQNVFGCEPDLTALGKMVGGGFPIGVVAGSESMMSVFDLRKSSPLLRQGGTFNANPISMAAGLATLELLTEEALSALNALGATTREKLAGAFKSAGVAGQVTGAGSLFRIHAHNRPIQDYRGSLATTEETQAAQRLWRYLINNGVLVNKMGIGCVSTATSKEEVDTFAQSLFAGLQRVAVA